VTAVGYGLSESKVSVAGLAACQVLTYSRGGIDKTIVDLEAFGKYLQTWGIGVELFNLDE
jgi:hypothetical protein